MKSNTQKNLPTKVSLNATTILVIVSGALVLVNVLLITYSLNEAKMVTLLKNELKVLDQDEQIIASSQSIYETYKDQIDVISSVFPIEETLLDFIQTLEGVVRMHADEYTFKFNAVTPLKEQERLFLPMTITMRTDLQRFLQFFQKLETLPYMTHVTSILTKTPNNFSGNGEVSVGLKMYVQNPFVQK